MKEYPDNHLAPLRSHGEVHVESLYKTYGNIVALNGIDLKVRSGEFIALLGPSGCGKTTLLRCVAGLVTPDRGDIRIDGDSVLRQPVHKRGLGMMFQNYALFPHMTVNDNVAFGLRMRRVATAEIQERVGVALKLMQISKLKDRMPAELSGGQQQRVALARAIVTSPHVLLLDEPLAALDAKLREQMQLELRRLQHQLGITTILVTHDQREALTMSDRVVVMSAGCVMQCGTPLEVYEQPRNAVVADFIGQMNKLQGTIRECGGSSVVELDTCNASLPIRSEAKRKIGGRVVAMIRPEKVRFQPGNDAGSESCHVMKARVLEVIFTGGQQMLVLDTKVGNIASVRSAARQDEPTVEQGVVGFASWEFDDVLVFSDEEDERGSLG